MTEAAADAEAREAERRAFICMQLAMALLNEGRAAEARAMVDLSARWAPQVARYVAHNGVHAIRGIAAATAVLHTPRGGELARPCAFLGTAGPTLSPAKEALIRAIFDQHQERFEASPAALAPMRDLYAVPADTPPAARPLRVFIVMARHINTNPAYIESDLFFHFSRTAPRAGLDTRAFEADALLYDSTKTYRYSDEEIAEARGRLDAALAEFRPDIILFEGNYVPTGRTLDQAWMTSVREAYGCRIVTVIADCYDTAQNYFGAWAEASDLVVTFNEEAANPHFSGFANKTFLACCLPFDEAIFDATAEKTGNMTFIGSDVRSRYEFLAFLDAFGIAHAAHLHNRSKAQAPDAFEYARILSSARMTYNTGRVSNSKTLSVLTGRCFEAFLSKTVLFEEVGSPLDHFCVPFVHYVPFASLHQLVMIAQFLEANDDYRQRIAEQAHSWHHAHFTSDRFWKALLRRLDLPALSPQPESAVPVPA